jgi:hypothetical protein
MKCCYCRAPIQPVDAHWVEISTGSVECKAAPDKLHARQRVLNLVVVS